MLHKNNRRFFYTAKISSLLFCFLYLIKSTSTGKDDDSITCGLCKQRFTFQHLKAFMQHKMSGCGEVEDLKKLPPGEGFFKAAEEVDEGVIKGLEKKDLEEKNLEKEILEEKILERKTVEDKKLESNKLEEDLKGVDCVWSRDVMETPNREANGGLEDTEREQPKNGLSENTTRTKENETDEDEEEEDDDSDDEEDYDFSEIYSEKSKFMSLGRSMI